MLTLPCRPPCVGIAFQIPGEAEFSGAKWPHRDVLFYPFRIKKKTEITNKLCTTLTDKNEFMKGFFLFNLLSFWVVFRPNSFEFIKMVWSKDRPIPCQVVKVVHNYSHKQIDDLQSSKNQKLSLELWLGKKGNLFLFCGLSHQKGTEHVEADKVNDGKLAAAVLTGGAVFVGRPFLTGSVGWTCQHDLLPCLACRTSDKQQRLCTIQREEQKKKYVC